ncbi:hypothetical protein Tco_1233559 [Tanacetum coccineum]
MSVSHSWRDVTNANSNATLEPIPLIKELDEEADALPTIAPTEAPHSRNHIKSPWTQNTSTEDVPSDRVSEGVSEMNLRYSSLVGQCDRLLARCVQLTNDLKEQTLIIVRVNEQETQLPA